MQMDSNTEDSNFFSSSSSHQSFYHEVKDDIIIDLGLSLGTSFQSQPYPSSGHCLSSGDYGDLMEWPQMKSYIKGAHVDRANMDEELEGVQSKERWAYVKVNMEGVVVGRKVSIVDHAGYSSLVVQLEHMFGKHCLSGLRLLEEDSEFCLFYKDKNERWRSAGDVPWKDFAYCVKRLKIVRKDEAHFPSSSSSLFN